MGVRGIVNSLKYGYRELNLIRYFVKTFTPFALLGTVEYEKDLSGYDGLKQNLEKYLEIGRNHGVNRRGEDELERESLEIISDFIKIMVDARFEKLTKSEIECHLDRLHERYKEFKEFNKKNPSIANRIEFYWES